MNVEFVEAELERWIELADRLGDIRYVSSSNAEERRQEIIRELFDRHVTTLQIVRKLIPGAKVPNLVYRRYELNDARYVETLGGVTWVRQALGNLRRSREVRVALGPSAPQLSADQFHKVVWTPASGLWADGHHGMAVQRGATNLSAHVQDMIGRYDLNDAPLMQEAFSSAPPKEGRPRLRWPGDPNSLTVKAMNDGIRSFAAGCFQAIRNPLTHSVDEIPRQEALEQLAALSVLARWTDGCKLIEAE